MRNWNSFTLSNISLVHQYQNTYEELKPSLYIASNLLNFRYQNTYEELKLKLLFNLFFALCEYQNTYEELKLKIIKLSIVSI